MISILIGYVAPKRFSGHGRISGRTWIWIDCSSTVGQMLVIVHLDRGGSRAFSCVEDHVGRHDWTKSWSNRAGPLSGRYRSLVVHERFATAIVLFAHDTLVFER